MALLIRLFFCIFVTGLFLYCYIDKINDLTELQLTIPAVARESKRVEEENKRLEYEIDRFESPIHLMELSRRPEYGHLSHPYNRDIIIIPKEKGSLNLCCQVPAQMIEND